MMRKILTLWDLDGNMVNVYRHHTPSYQSAIKSVYDIKLLLEEIEANYGKPASEVVAIPLRSKNVPEEKIQDGLQRTFQIYANQLEKRIRSSGNDGIAPVLPGVINLLERLVAENIPRGVVTGNIRLAGETILKATDLS
ncbi:HAD family phosphatase, partial [Candidatus Woesearchaeota archaeon]|nr:HAD family phosphatase [Candidatus Woesearchaeota archaeon]